VSEREVTGKAITVAQTDDCGDVLTSNIRSFGVGMGTTMSFERDRFTIRVQLESVKVPSYCWAFQKRQKTPKKSPNPQTKAEANNWSRFKKKTLTHNCQVRSTRSYVNL
jgi:hypothetical protein